MRPKPNRFAPADDPSRAELLRPRPQDQRTPRDEHGGANRVGSDNRDNSSNHLGEAAVSRAASAVGAPAEVEVEIGVYT